MTTIQQLAAGPTLARPKSADERLDVDMDSGSRVPTNTPNSLGAFANGPQRGDSRIVVIVHGERQDKVVSIFADVLGKTCSIRSGFEEVSHADQGLVVGIASHNAKRDVVLRDKELVVAINAHCVDLGMPPDTHLSTHCDYEFLYTENSFFRRDLSRFTSFTLGQINHHQTLMAKPRTYFISTTFPDVSAALPNIDILTVGADAVEIRVDLLREPLGGGVYSDIPSLSYVGQQVMMLRQRTELPIIFTTRCTRENGRFPMENPDLYYEYLYRAIQWGVEYIDVELWLPEEIRSALYRQRGNSRIMSAFHDFSGTFRWPSQHAEQVYVESSRYADITKMITIINDHNENFELEYFRSRMRIEHADSPPLSGVNMGETGQFSRTLNRVFTPITHPLLPIVAAPGQMSASEINAALALLGQLPKKNIYGVTCPSFRNSVPQAPFYEKCFNELGLPHNFIVVERQMSDVGCMEAWCNQKNFGGAYLSPPISWSSLLRQSSFFASLNGANGLELTEAARVIGTIDTIVVKSSSSPALPSASASVPSSPRRRNHPTGAGGLVATSNLPPSTSLVLDNAHWRGILSTLTRDLAPSAYFGRSAVVLASSSDDAASVIFALRALRISKIYTVGFKVPASLVKGGPTIEPFNSLESLQRARVVGDRASPFVIVSALGPDKGNLVGMLVRVFGATGREEPDFTKKVFLDLADTVGARKGGDPSIVAEQSGFSAYGSADTAAFTTVETLRLLVGQNVPYSFVRLASGRGLF